MSSTVIIFLYFESNLITLELFFPSSIVEWDKLSWEVGNSENIRVFKNRFLEFTRSLPDSIFDIYNPYAIMLLTRLRLYLNHLKP